MEIAFFTTLQAAHDEKFLMDAKRSILIVSFLHLTQGNAGGSANRLWSYLRNSDHTTLMT
jgi:hypothetical protein